MLKYLEVVLFQDGGDKCEALVILFVIHLEVGESRCVGECAC